MKKILFILGIMTLVFTVSSCSNNSQLKKEIEELNATLPQDMGGIRLDKAELDNNTVKYFYTYTVEVDTPTEGNLVAAKNEMIQVIKNNPLMKPFKDNKLNISCIYNSINGTKLYEIEITPEDYK